MTKYKTINPTTLDEALETLNGCNVMPIAGGTDLLVKFYEVYGKSLPKLVVLDGLIPLHEIKTENDRISLGPLVTFSEIENSPELRKAAPQLVQAASVAGSVQIRNRATIGGNIANGSPSGDLIPPLYVLNAELELSSVNGRRSIPIDKFFKGPGITVLEKNELITSISFDKTFENGFFLRLATRKALAISKVSVAANYSMQNGTITNVRIALGAVAPTVIRAPRTEEYLSGKELNDNVLSTAAKLIKEEAKPISDIRSIADYRREMVGVLLKRGLNGIPQSE
ncbi:MAG: xanthine dehydrogenase family protein subunit M [candidate division Zixibacteria bacterium]|nr:xanthine dehydrogenase family protein subunit M [candidate division Zixibacteria bacterium]